MKITVYARSIRSLLRLPILRKFEQIKHLTTYCLHLVAIEGCDFLGNFVPLFVYHINVPRHGKSVLNAYSSREILCSVHLISPITTFYPTYSFFVSKVFKTADFPRIVYLSDTSFPPVFTSSSPHIYQHMLLNTLTFNP